jgi:hypothetical protein
VTLSAELTDEVRRAVRRLVGARLEPERWDRVRTDLRRLGEVVVAGDEAAVRDRLVPVAHAGFEGAVHRRLGTGRGAAPVVVPTKRTSALPWIGAVCAALLLALGWVLGGGLVLVATAALAAGVFAVALAGTRANLARARRARARRDPGGDRVVTTPSDVLALVAELERALD